MRWQYRICETDNGNQKAFWEYPYIDTAAVVYDRFVETIADFDEYRSGLVRVELGGRSVFVFADNSIIPFENPEFEEAMIAANSMAMDALTHLAFGMD